MRDEYIASGGKLLNRRELEPEIAERWAGTVARRPVRTFLDSGALIAAFKAETDFRLAAVLLFLDSGALIAAFKGGSALAEPTVAMLNDPSVFS